MVRVQADRAVWGAAVTILGDLATVRGRHAVLAGAVGAGPAPLALGCGSQVSASAVSVS